MAYDRVLQQFARFGYRFFRLAPTSMSLLCKIEILFLRPDPPGGLVKSADLDNRLKTLFDALRLPHNDAELGGHEVGEDEDPFFCLLEDDKLIDHVRVETDMLLQPTQDRNDCKLVITVELQPYRVTNYNLGFS